MDEQQFVGLLESLLLPDTERVKSATAQLNKTYYTSPASLNALLHILTSHEKKELRQLAAVEARKLVTKHWTALPDKPTTRTNLLNATMNEDDKLVRHSASRVISAIAKMELADGEWTDLPKLLQQGAVSQTVKHREVSVYIIFTLLELMGDLFMENLGQLFGLFSKTLQDPESGEVRINTMLAISRISMLLDPDDDPQALKAFQDCVPLMVQILKSTIDASDEAQAMQAFEVFQTFLGGDAALLNKHFADLIKFMLEISANTQIDDEFRSQALAFLMQAVRYRKLKIQGLRLGEQMTLAALKIVTELEDLNSDDEDVVPARSALGLLDILASSLPPSQVVVPLLKAIGPYVTSQDPEYRRAGILALGMTVEGAPDFILTQLNEILPMVLHLLEDPNVKVRAAALNGVARLADDLAEDMGKEHARLIPALVKNFDAALSELHAGKDEDENIGILRGSCNAIDSLIEGLEPSDAAQYLPILFPRLSQLFNSNDFRSKVAAIGAVGSLAAAGEEAFMPYFESTMQALAPYVPLKESQDDLDLRGVVCDTFGKIAGAVGAKPFEPYVRPLMEASEEALHLDHPRLRETSYILWSTMAKVYEEAFEPYLEGVVKGLQDCLSQDEGNLEIELGEEAKDLVGQEVVISGRKIKVASAGDDTEDDVLDMDDEDGDDDWDDLEGVSAVAMEKEIAVEVIGDVVSYTKSKYLPYLQKTVETVLQLVEHTYEGVRKAAIGTLWRSYACLWGMAEANGMEKWQPGLPLKVQPTADLAKLANLVMTGTLAVWQDEVDRACVTDINRDLAASLRLCGPAMLVNDNGTVVPQISNQVIAILTKKHPCQEEEDEPDEELEETSEYDWLVIDTALDVVVCLAAALGLNFAELWKIFEKPILKYASSQEAVERSTAVGTVAECIGSMGDAVTPFTTGLLKVLLHRLGDEDPDTKANAAYGIGLLCEKSGNQQEILKNFNTILGKLEPLLHNQQSNRILDNSAGCVARMITKYPNNVPITEVLPRLVEILPLREDHEENKPVYNMIVTLYQAGNETVRGLTPRLMPVFEKVLGPPESQLEDDTRAQLIELVQHLQRQ